MSLQLIQGSVPVQQGAEARVSLANLHPGQPPILLKHRFRKQYRHASLDADLTRTRVTSEARALLRCLRGGVAVPGVRMVDAEHGVLGIEWIDGKSVRNVLGSADEVNSAESGLPAFGITQGELMAQIGRELAKMHCLDVIHGDLTTSNMMLSAVPGTPPAKIVLIDFGLSYMSAAPEDKAVDLYVLERAFASTHPDSEDDFKAVIIAYAGGMGNAWADIGRRLDDVRLRGRKRSMVG